jgi:CO/xanthine dehydrogenase FAD-binding subunit
LEPFEYFAPSSITDALLLLDAKREARVLAGGTDLLVQLKQRELSAECLIDLKLIPELRGVELGEDNHLHVGALTTVSEIIGSDIVNDEIPILRQVAESMGSWQVRNKATIGGNICRAAPSADFAPVLLALDAQLKIVNSRAERIVNLTNFFTGPGKTVLQRNDILQEIIIQVPSGSWALEYGRQSRRKTMDLALVNVAVFLMLDSRKSVCEDIRIAVGSVAPTPVRARNAEQYLSKAEISTERINTASRMAAEETDPISDVYGSAWYKREVVRAQTARTLKEAHSNFCRC